MKTRGHGGRAQPRIRTLNSEQLSHRIAAVAGERKAQDIVIMDVRGRCSYADFLVVCSGTSDRHMQSIAELIDETLRHEGNKCLSREGYREGQWALIDFGSVVAHVFHPFTRQVYNLEEMWHDAPCTHVGESSDAGVRYAAQ